MSPKKPLRAAAPETKVVHAARVEELRADLEAGLKRLVAASGT